jgi:predicted metal-dependent hydrolase
MTRLQDEKSELRARAREWASQLRVTPRMIRIQPMRNKWGSCSTRGTVTLAADLIQQARPFQDCVIVHELLHLRYATHGKVFKAVMSAYVPRWRELFRESGNCAILDPFTPRPNDRRGEWDDSR